MPFAGLISGAERNGAYRSRCRLFVLHLSKSLRDDSRISRALSSRRYSEPVPERRVFESFDWRNRNLSFREVLPLLCLYPNNLQPPNSRFPRDGLIGAALFTRLPFGGGSGLNQLVGKPELD